MIAIATVYPDIPTTWILPKKRGGNRKIAPTQFGAQEFPAIEQSWPRASGRRGPRPEPKGFPDSRGFAGSLGCEGGFSLPLCRPRAEGFTAKKPPDGIRPIDRHGEIFDEVPDPMRDKPAAARGDRSPSGRHDVEGDRGQRAHLHGPLIPLGPRLLGSSLAAGPAPLRHHLGDQVPLQSLLHLRPIAPQEDLRAVARVA